ncbi:MAG: hypothetical protein ACREV3_04630 [Gammaproteobacteria bacterium]
MLSRQTACGNHAVEEDGSRKPDDEIVEVVGGIPTTSGSIIEIKAQDIFGCSAVIRFVCFIGNVSGRIRQRSA